MKQVSFTVAKSLKEAGYPQDIEDTVYLSNGELYTFDNENPLFQYVPNCCCDAPTYLEVWLWLWREKNIQIRNCTNDTIIRLVDFKPYRTICLFGNAYSNDPEEAIIAAIEYLVENKLLK